MSYFIFHSENAQSKGVYGAKLMAKIPHMGLDNRNLLSQSGGQKSGIRVPAGSGSGESARSPFLLTVPPHHVLVQQACVERPETTLLLPRPRSYWIRTLPLQPRSVVIAPKSLVSKHGLQHPSLLPCSNSCPSPMQDTHTPSRQPPSLLPHSSINTLV